MYTFMLDLLGFRILDRFTDQLTGRLCNAIAVFYRASDFGVEVAP